MGISGVRFPLPAEIVGKPHRTRGVALHGVNAAVGGARSRSDHRPRMRCQPVDPIAGEDRLARLRVGAEGSPVALRFVAFVWNGTFHHQDERIQPAFSRTMERPEEIISHFVGQHGVVQPDWGSPGKRAVHQLFERGLSRGGDGDSLAVAAEPGRQPEDIHFGNAKPGSSPAKLHGGVSEGLPPSRPHSTRSTKPRP